MEITFDVILSSPLIPRAADRRDHRPQHGIGKADALWSASSLPDGVLTDVLALIERRRAKANSLLLVGHEPNLSRLISCSAPAAIQSRSDAQERRPLPAGVDRGEIRPSATLGGCSRQTFRAETKNSHGLTGGGRIGMRIHLQPAVELANCAASNGSFPSSR